MTGNAHSELASLIKDAVAQYWAVNQKAMLLSNLGLVIRRDRPALLSNVEGGLQKFIEGADIVQVVRHPAQSQKIGAIPLTVPVPEELESLFSDGLRAPRHPRLVPDFWQAFQRKIKTRRYVIFFIGSMMVLDELAPPKGSVAYEILPADIVDPVPTQGSERIAVTWEKIAAWLERNKLDVAVVTDREKPSAVPEVRSAKLSHEVLGRRLAELPPSDQARISIPLDIVAKLFAQE